MTVSRLPYSETFGFPHCNVRVDSGVKYALTELSRVYRSFQNGGQVLSVPTFVVRRRKGKLRFSRITDNGASREVLIERGRVMPSIEREINQYLVNTLGDQSLLHASCVARRNRAIVFPATAGSGKTTLAAGLVERGCGYLTDELVILHKRSSSVVPFPKAMSLKEGSFRLFGQFGPDPTGPEHDRVWYLDPERLRPGCVVKKPTPIGWVVLPHYEAGAKTRIKPLTVGETVLGLFENTVNIARHKQKGLDRLIKIAKKAPGHRLVFGDLDKACEAILGVVEDNGKPCG